MIKCIIKLSILNLILKLTEVDESLISDFRKQGG